MSLVFEGQMRLNTRALIESFDKSCKKFFWMRQIYIHTYMRNSFIVPMVKIDSYKVKKNIIIFQKEKGNALTLLIIVIVKSLQKE